MHIRPLMMVAVCAAAGFAAQAADEKKSEAPTPPPPAMPVMPAMPVLKLVAPTTVVAVVNGVELRQSDVNERLEKVMKMLGGRIPAEKQGMFRAQVSGRVLDELVMQTLLLAAADKAKIEVTPDDLKKAIKDLPVPPGQTVEATYEAQGMNKAEFEKEIGTGLKIQKLIEKETGGNTKVTEEDIKKFFDENKERLAQPETVTARHILVKIDKGADDKAKAAAKAKAEGLRKQLQDGADFAKLAKENSDDPGSKETGGEYTFPRGQMVPAFENAAFSQPLKEIGPLVETPFGYHIIQSLSKNAAKSPTLADVKADIVKYLENKNKGEVVQKYIADLKAKSDIKYPEAK